MSFLNTIITVPFSWLLLALYNFSQSYGISLILFSLIVKLILLPFSIKSKRNMMKMGRLTPKLKALEKQYKNDKNKYAQETQLLYQKYGINPMSGCLWSLIPLPIMLGLYSVIRKPLTNLMKLSVDQIKTITDTLAAMGVKVSSNTTYGEIDIAQQIHNHFNAIKAVVPNVISMDYHFLGINLADTPRFNIFQQGGFTWASVGLFLLPVLSGVLAFLSMRVTNRSNNVEVEKGERTAADKTNRQMSFIMPLVSIYIGFVMPAGLSVYWIANSAFSTLQEFALGKIIGSRLDQEEAVRAKREALLEEAEKKRRAELIAQGHAPSGGKKKHQKQQKQQRPQKRAAVTHEKGKIGDRPYARGRSYEEIRYSDLREPPKETGEKASQGGGEEGERRDAAEQNK
ncbi:MAG: YidC/Oxa1 family membrane protein insertase [Oscillospiraceae bacterium]|nr:YidC/Oxa1 family membrane protein insertase [Oscillospiraceae bacterium]